MHSEVANYQGHLFRSHSDMHHRVFGGKANLYHVTPTRKLWPNFSTLQVTSKLNADMAPFLGQGLRLAEVATKSIYLLCFWNPENRILLLWGGCTGKHKPLTPQITDIKP